ncbi:MAG: branched-chain amino acid ABC transporter permease [Oscillospiraceae bacterium]|nr:branched-chain amino acid ABC transporter permease [Oscillospiraceae bacterium]
MSNVFHDIFQLILSNFHIIGVLALTTVGLSLTFKTANVANFAQAITSTIGAYVAGLLLRDFGFGPWESMIIGVAVCFVIGFLLDAAVVRHVGGGGGRIMVTIGLIVLITAAIPLVFGTIPYNFPRFFTGQIEFRLFGQDFNVTQNAMFILIASAVVIAVIFSALRFTKWGLGVRGTASNIYVASMMGVNTNMMTALSWAISSACGGLAAVFLASQTQLISITMLGATQANSLLAFVVGGFASFYGPAIGAAIIPIVLSLLTFVSSIWASALLYIIVMIVILIKPAGLFGKKSVKKV